MTFIQIMNKLHMEASKHKMCDIDKFICNILSITFNIEHFCVS